MKQHTPWINNGGRIERVLDDETTEVLCTVGEVNNQSLDDTERACHILRCLNTQPDLLEALEELTPLGPLDMSDRERYSCHYDIVPLEECAQCNRIKAARIAIAKARP